MNILVTGCMGFIGSNTVINLINAGHKVLGVDNLSNPSIDPTSRIKSATKERWSNFVFFKADILSLEHMLSICANYQPDAIVHLAAIGSVPRSFEEPIQYVKTNEIGFLNMLYLAQVFRVKKLIYASSSSVYGDTDILPRKEGCEGRALSPYALSKKHNECVAHMWKDSYGISSIGLRFFNVYGPGQRHDSAYSAVIPRWINSEKLMVNGDGNCVRDFTYVDDVVACIQSALYGKENHFIANVGTGIGTSLKDLAQIISQGKKEIEFKDPRSSDVHKSVACTLHLQSRIGYKPSTTIDEGVRETIKFYEAQKC